MSKIEDDGPGLLDVLSRLLTALEPARAGDPILDAQRGSVPERWEDQDYIYVEARLACETESVIDICINGHTVFIRIAQ